MDAFWNLATCHLALPLFWLSISTRGIFLPSISNCHRRWSPAGDLSFWSYYSNKTMNQTLTLENKADAPTAGVTTVKIRLLLDVEYDLNGVDSAEMVQRLTRMCESAIGDGMLTGGTDAEVAEYSMDVTMYPAGIDEDEVADFMLKRIESGDLSLEDIPYRMAAFGLMDPVAFANEMLERKQLMDSEKLEESKG